MSWLVLVLFGILALAAAAVIRRRIREYVSRAEADVTDEVVRRIEEEGRVDLREDEPLDLDEIEDEEDRFWSETWDEPDPY